MANSNTNTVTKELHDVAHAAYDDFVKADGNPHPFKGAVSDQVGTTSPKPESEEYFVISVDEQFSFMRVNRITNYLVELTIFNRINDCFYQFGSILVIANEERIVY